jgi:hypothetical protein
MAFENDYARLLGGNSMIALSGDTLVVVVGARCVALQAIGARFKVVG